MSASALDGVSRVILGGLAEAAVRALTLAFLVGAGLWLFRVQRSADRLVAWRIVLWAALAMPIVGAVVPSMPVPIPAFAASFVSDSTRGGATQLLTAISDAAAPSTSAQSTGPALAPAALLGLYLAGVIWLATRAGRGWLAARHLARAARPIEDSRARARAAAHARTLGLRRVPRLAETDRLQVPVTMAVRRPVVILPASWRTWPPETIDAVLIHELSHVSRRDALTQQLALALRAASWPSPLGWWLRRRVTALAEEASDEAAIARGVEPTRYADILLGFLIAVRNGRDSEWHLAMARGKGVERRVERVLEWRRSRPMSLSSRASVVLVAVTTLVVWFTSAVRPVPASASSASPASSTQAAVAPAPDPAPPPAVTAPPAVNAASKSGQVARDDVGQRRPPPPPPAAPPPSQRVQVLPPPPPPPPPPGGSYVVPDDDFAKDAFAADTPGLVAPKVVRHVIARYTSNAMRAKIQGVVIVQIIVEADGSVGKARVIQPLDSDLDEQALLAVRQWTFRAGELGGRPVPVAVIATLEFRLH